MSSAGPVAIPGSERELVAGHERVGSADPGETVSVSVYLRPREPYPADAGREPMSREDWAAAHGASERDLGAVKAFASAHELRVTDEDAGRRSLRLTGSVGALMDAFAVKDLALYRHPDGRVYRGRQGSLSVPPELAGVIEGVFGIDDRPQARPHFRRLGAAAAAGTSYTPVQVAEAYDFPAGLNGEGQTLAIIELEGGYRDDDLNTFFGGLGLTPPEVTAVAVNGGSNTPGTKADGEVMLDIEVVGAVAPKAAIAVYFTAGASDGDFIDAVSQAVHDTQRKPSIVSISWGAPEEAWSGQGRLQMEQVLSEAAGVGVTVTVASGDSGSTDGAEDARQHVDFPASAPHALACGGTSLVIEGGRIARETVWNDGAEGGATGGGISVEFSKPTYQDGVQVRVNAESQQPGRGVPDVAGDADPETGYQVRVDGSDGVIGGTSAVAPLWAALIARINQALGTPVGYLQPKLYPLAGTDAFNDITVGDNGSYQADPGWDACTGLGSPKGDTLLAALKA